MDMLRGLLDAAFLELFLLRRRSLRISLGPLAVGEAHVVSLHWHLSVHQQHDHECRVWNHDRCGNY